MFLFYDILFGENATAAYFTLKEVDFYFKEKCIFAKV